jgi:hypothetical protein
MNAWISLLALIQMSWTKLLIRINKYRRAYFLPTDRDMVFVNGDWSYDPAEATLRYDVEKHAILIATSGRTVRWKWLSVVTDKGRDISDFFCNLRISAGAAISDEIVLSLFEHQKRHSFNNRYIDVILRDGTQERIFYIR